MTDTTTTDSTTSDTEYWSGYGSGLATAADLVRTLRDHHKEAAVRAAAAELHDTLAAAYDLNQERYERAVRKAQGEDTVR